MRRYFWTALIGVAFFSVGSRADDSTKITVYPGSFTVPIDDEDQARQAANEIPGNVQLVDDRQWAGQRAATIKDITDYIPGVYAQPRDGAESDRLSVRGSSLANYFQGEGLLVLQDGIPINMADGEFEFPVIDPWLIKYAVVKPGADALEEGASELGGAIDFITPTGTSEPGYNLRAEGGSFGTLHGLAADGLQFKGGDAYIAASGFHQEGFRSNNQQNSGRLNANVGWEPSDNFTNRLYLNHTVSDPMIPGAISKSMISQDPTQANPLNAVGQYERYLNITRLADKAAWQEGPDRVETTLFYTYRYLNNPVTTYILEHNNDVGGRLKYIHTTDPTTFTSGINIYYGTQDETRYRNVGGEEGTHILDRDLFALTTEAYAQVEQHLIGHLFGIVGTQGSYATRDIRQSTPTSAEQTEHYAGFNPRLGLRYDANKVTQLFGNISRSFQPPTFSELSGGNAPGFNQLNAQTATTGELGARGTLDGIHWSAAVYHSQIHDEFVNYQFADGSTSTANVNRSIHDGLEAGLDGDLFHNALTQKDAVFFRAAYTFGYYYLEHDPRFGDNRLPGEPPHYLRAELLYKHPSGFAVGPNIEWSPQAYPVDLANSLNADPYIIYGARALWTSADGRLNFYLEGRNLSNRHYIATTNVVPNANGTDGRYFYPGEGRAFYTGLQIKF